MSQVSPVSSSNFVPATQDREFLESLRSFNWPVKDLVRMVRCSQEPLKPKYQEKIEHLKEREGEQSLRVIALKARKGDIESINSIAIFLASKKDYVSAGRMATVSLMLYFFKNIELLKDDDGNGKAIFLPYLQKFRNMIDPKSLSVVDTLKCMNVVQILVDFLSKLKIASVQPMQSIFYFTKIYPSFIKFFAGYPDNYVKFLYTLLQYASAYYFMHKKDSSTWNTKVAFDLLFKCKFEAASEGKYSSSVWDPASFLPADYYVALDYAKHQGDQQILAKIAKLASTEIFPFPPNNMTQPELIARMKYKVGPSVYFDYIQGLEHVRCKEYDESLSCMLRALEARSDNDLILSHIGLLYFSGLVGMEGRLNPDYEKAFEYYKRVKDKQDVLLVILELFLTGNCGLLVNGEPDLAYLAQIVKSCEEGSLAVIHSKIKILKEYSFDVDTMKHVDSPGRKILSLAAKISKERLLFEEAVLKLKKKDLTVRDLKDVEQKLLASSKFVQAAYGYLGDLYSFVEYGQVQGWKLNYEKAIAYLREILKLGESSEIREKISSCYTLLGMQNPQEKKYWYQSIEELRFMRGSQALIQEADFVFRGYINSLDDGKQDYDRAIELYKSVPYPNLVQYKLEMAYFMRDIQVPFMTGTSKASFMRLVQNMIDSDKLNEFIFVYAAPLLMGVENEAIDHVFQTNEIVFSYFARHQESKQFDLKFNYDRSLFTFLQRNFQFHQSFELGDELESKLQSYLDELETFFQLVSKVSEERQLSFSQEDIFLKAKALYHLFNKDIDQALDFYLKILEKPNLRNIKKLEDQHSFLFETNLFRFIFFGLLRIFDEKNVFAANEHSDLSMAIFCEVGSDGSLKSPQYVPYFKSEDLSHAKTEESPITDVISSETVLSQEQEKFVPPVHKQKLKTRPLLNSMFSELPFGFSNSASASLPILGDQDLSQKQNPCIVQYLSHKTEDSVEVFQQNNPHFSEIFEEIKRNPITPSKGQPEVLKHKIKGISGCRSVRIDKKNRLVYKVLSAQEIVIISCDGHYQD